jgi:hypothetical protein
MIDVIWDFLSLTWVLLVWKTPPERVVYIKYNDHTGGFWYDKNNLIIQK